MKIKDIRATTYYVTGNHEEFGDRNKYLHAVKRAGIRVLDNERVEAEGLQIIGVHDGEADEPEYFRSVLRSAGGERDRASILVVHQPANLAVAEEELAAGLAAIAAAAERR